MGTYCQRDNYMQLVVSEELGRLFFTDGESGVLFVKNLRMVIKRMEFYGNEAVSHKRRIGFWATWAILKEASNNFFEVENDLIILC